MAGEVGANLDEGRQAGPAARDGEVSLDFPQRTVGRGVQFFLQGNGQVYHRAHLAKAGFPRQAKIIFDNRIWRTYILKRQSHETKAERRATMNEDTDGETKVTLGSVKVVTRGHKDFVFMAWNNKLAFTVECRGPESVIRATPEWFAQSESVWDQVIHEYGVWKRSVMPKVKLPKWSGGTSTGRAHPWRMKPPTPPPTPPPDAPPK